MSTTSRNPDIDEMGKNKARLILLNKSDLSDPAANRAWTAYFESLGFAVLEINARSGAGMKAIQGKASRKPAGKRSSATANAVF